MENTLAITCRICGKNEPRKTLSQHLKKYHGMTYSYYVSQHLDDFPNWHKCEICQTITNRHRCSRECDAKWKSQQYSGRIGTPHSNETKEHLSQIKKRYFKTHDHPLLGKHHSGESKQLMSESAKQFIQNGGKRGMSGKTHTAATVKKIFKHQKMNKLEKLVAKTLKKAGYEFTFQFFITEDGICKSYDFKIKGKPIIFESDGDYWHGNPDTKYHHETAEKNKLNDIYKTKLAKKRGYVVLRAWESEIKRNPQIIIDKINEYLSVKK